MRVKFPRVRFPLAGLPETSASDSELRRWPRRLVVEALGEQPRPQGARPLVDYPGLWRVGIGDHRVIYATRDTEFVVLALRVAHRQRRLPEPLIEISGCF